MGISGMTKKSLYILISSLFLGTIGFSMENEDLPLIDLKENKIRLVYQSEAAFLHADSPYDYLVTTNLWPCIGLVFSFYNFHLLVHKDDLTDLNSIKDLLMSKGLSEHDLSDVRITMFSRKMKEKLYNQWGFFEAFKSLTQAQELERTKNILIALLKINPDQVRVFLSTGDEKSIVVAKEGQIFRSWHVNKNFCPLDGLDIVSNSQYSMPHESAKRREVESYFTDESKKLMKLAYDKHREMVNFGSAKPYVRDYDAPKDWPVVIKGPVCEIKNCYRLADSHCGRCKKSHYCSQFCQKKDWPNHKTKCTSK